METLHISPRAKQCQFRFQALQSALVEAHHDEHLQSATRDSSERYAIWAANLGVYHDPADHKSADYRLREALSISKLIVQDLEELLDVLDNAIDIANGTQPDASLSEETEDGDWQEDVPETESSELGELVAITSDIITNLLKISIVIRQSSDRDRYAKAAASGEPPFLRDIDVRRIGELFPKVRDRGSSDDEDRSDEHAWLRERLGNANVQRRQFLRYIKNHHNRLANAPSISQGPKLLSAANQPAPALFSGLRPPSQAPSSRPTLAPTDSSTINLSKLPQNLTEPVLEQQNDVDDALSFVSSQHRADESGAELKHRIIPLEDVSNGRLHFECPYCRSIIQPGTRPKWKKHVFGDLRAYVCTFQDCRAGLFEDRREWFRHELEVHRRRWTCQVCSKNFRQPSALGKHLREAHQSKVPSEEMLEPIVAASSRPIAYLRPSDCPLCDQWSTQLREQAEHQGLDSDQIVVALDDFRRHLGEHLEQIALFSIPPALDAQSISGSQKDRDRTAGNAALVTQWQHGTANEDAMMLENRSTFSDASSSHESEHQAEAAERGPTTSATESTSYSLRNVFRHFIVAIGVFRLSLKHIRRRRICREYIVLFNTCAALMGLLRLATARRLILSFRQGRHVIRHPSWLYAHEGRVDFHRPRTPPGSIKHWYRDWKYGDPRLLYFYGGSLNFGLAHGGGEQPDGRVEQVAQAAFLGCPGSSKIATLYIRTVFHDPDMEKLILHQLLRKMPNRVLEIKTLYHLWGIDVLTTGDTLAMILQTIGSFKRVFLVLCIASVSIGDSVQEEANIRVISRLAESPNVSALVVADSQWAHDTLAGFEVRPFGDALADGQGVLGKRIVISRNIVAAARKGRKRVKVYELKNNDWFDRGTGFCDVNVLSDLDAPIEKLDAQILVSGEDDPSRMLLKTRISKDDGYQRQQDTLIVWTDSSGIDMALSFQEADDCGTIWNFISYIQEFLDDVDLEEVSDDGSNVERNSEEEDDVAEEYNLGTKQAEREKELRSNLYNLDTRMFRATSPLEKIGRLAAMNVDALRRRQIFSTEIAGTGLPLRDFGSEVGSTVGQSAVGGLGNAALAQSTNPGEITPANMRTLMSGLDGALGSQGAMSDTLDEFEEQDKKIQQMGRAKRSAEDDGAIL